MVTKEIVHLNDITAGPGKYDLMLALFDSTAKQPRPVVFHADGGPCGYGPYTVHVSSVDREDGSGESWNFCGSWYSHRDEKWYTVKGYYSTKRRAGHISFHQP